MSLAFRCPSLENLEPLEQTEEGAALREVLQEEVLKMTEKIGKSARPLPFDLCRRGALLRKLGQVVKAKHDLDQAIAAEPLLVHAYWQRHLLHLLQGKKTDALDDLNSIIKINRNHVGAYVSRAEILTIKDPTIAITNLTQALKIEPTNADVYMKRAGMYEQRGQVLLAMEDYAKAYKLNPRLTIAIFKRGSYYFNHQSWQPAVNDFSEVLKKEPGNAAARLYRGRCYTKLGLWQQAVQDLSAAIHYDPNSWEAYYWRGCAFRKCNPRQALLDYSVSILINDGEDNIKSLLHRGILYDAMGRPEDAVPDFEAILKLRKDVSVAHLNLGLIYLTKMQWYPK